MTSALAENTIPPSLQDNTSWIFKHITLTISLWMAQTGNVYSPAHPELRGRLSLIVIWEKPRQRCWQLWCVLRGMHRCYHSLSYARTIRWKPLPGTVLGLGLLMHRLNTHSVACWHTHTEQGRSCPEDFLITLSEWEVVWHTEGRPLGLSHTPPRLPIFLPIILFLTFIYVFFSLRGHEVYGRQSEEKKLVKAKIKASL